MVCINRQDIVNKLMEVRIQPHPHMCNNMQFYSIRDIKINITKAINENKYKSHSSQYRNIIAGSQVVIQYDCGMTRA